MGKAVTQSDTDGILTEGGMDRIYTTVSGDTWDVIAKKVYGDEYGAGFLMASNPYLLDTFKFSAGTEVSVPDFPEELDGDLPPWKVTAEEDEEEYEEIEDYEDSEDEDEGEDE